MTAPGFGLLPMAAAVALVAGPAASGPPSPPVPAAPRALSPDDEAQLDRGEEVLRLLPTPDGRHREGLAARVLPRSAGRVWRAVADLDHWHEWVPFLEASERTPTASGSPLWRLRFDLPLPLRDRHYAARARVSGPGGGSGAGGTLSWESVPGSGNVAWARGSFAVAPRGPGRALVVFRTATDTGDRTPAFLLDRALRESLPWVLEGLAQQVNRCRYTVPYPDGCREERPYTP